MDKRNKQLKRAVSLRYGAVYAKWMDVLIYLFLFVFAFCLVGSTGNLIYIGKFDYYVFEVVIFSVLVLGLLIFLLIKLYKVRKTVAQEMADAVELEAKAYKSDEKGNLYEMVGLEPPRLSVIFTYNGEKQLRVSDKMSVKRVLVGYEFALKKYANKTVRILYSPQYDHVVIVNDSMH